MPADWIPTDTERHLLSAHGFNAWSWEDFRDQYREFDRGPDDFDFPALHARDHQRNQWELDHEYDAEAN